MGGGGGRRNEANHIDKLNKNWPLLVSEISHCTAHNTTTLLRHNRNPGISVTHHRIVWSAGRLWESFSFSHFLISEVYGGLSIGQACGRASARGGAASTQTQPRKLKWEKGSDIISSFHHEHQDHYSLDKS